MGTPVESTGAIIGLMLFGTISSILSKVLYQVNGKGRAGHTKLFKKPWASTALMFLAMTFCLPVSQLLLCWQRRKTRVAHAHDAASEPLITSSDVKEAGAAPKSWKSTAILLLPTIFDLVATLLMSIGLLYVSASIYQMLRGAEILFSALFAVTLLKRSLNKLHLIGIVGCLLGVSLVGASSLLTPSGDKSADAGKALLGMALIVLAQAVQAAQVTVEDYAMSNVGLEPLSVVGLEGVFGTAINFLLLLPLAQFLPGREGEGIHEDSIDTWHMITHSVPWWAIPTVLIIQGIALLAYNMSGMFVTEGLGAVSRTVLESARTLFVWLTDLGLFYVVGDFGLGRLGEGWDRSSWLQLGGFVILIAATLVYARGDQIHEKELASDHSSTAPKHTRNFRAHHTISRHTRTAVSLQRWKKRAAAAVAEARDAVLDPITGA